MAVELHSLLSECDDAVYTVPTGTVAVGDIIEISTDIFGFSLKSGEAGDVIAVITRAPIVSVPFVVPTGGVPVGSSVYYNIGTGAITRTSGGDNRIIGTTREPGVLGDTRIVINFDGRLSL